MLTTEFQELRAQVEKAQADGVAGDGVEALKFNLGTLRDLLAIADEVGDLFKDGVTFETPEGVAATLNVLNRIAMRGSALTTNTADDKVAALIGKAAQSPEVCAIIANVVKLAEKSSGNGSLPPGEQSAE